MKDFKKLISSKETIAVFGFFLLCVLVGRFGVWGRTGRLGNPLAILLGIICLIPLFFYVFQSVKKKDWKQYLPFCAISLISNFSIILIQWIHYIQVNNGDEGTINVLQENWVLGITTLLILACCFITFVFNRKSKDISRYAYYFAFVSTTALRFAHVVSVRYQIFQNDLGQFNAGRLGHAGYIYLIYNGANLLDINPLGYDQLYHPPFYHFLAAIYLRLQSLVGCRFGDMALDVIQTFSLFVSFLTILYLMKLIRKLGADDWGCIMTLGVITVIHYFNQSAGLINNDSILLLLCIMSIYYCMVWIEERSIKSIIGCGITIGLAMMTKLSAVALAIPMAVVFLVVLIKERKDWKKIVKHFIYFGLISLPLGLWHPIYYYFRFGKPLNYCPRITIPTMKIYYGRWDFIFNFDGCFESINPNMTSEMSEYIEHNIPISLLKHAVVGEGFKYTLTKINEIMAYCNYAIVWLVAGLIIVSMVLFLIKKEYSVEKKILIIGTILSFLLFLLKFVWDYPYTCTINIRYVLVSVLLGAACIGLMFSNGKKWQIISVKILFILFTLSGYLWSTCVMLSL